MSAKEEAKKLLPISHWADEGEEITVRDTYRPAVAAALEARDKRIEELEKANTNQRFHSKRTAQVLVAKSDEIQVLRARLEPINSPWDRPCEHRYAAGWCLPCVTRLGRAFDELRAEVERMKAKEG